MKITAVRHGETIENATGIVQGQSYGTLSETGRDQTRQLGQKLKDHKFDIIYTSDLERCMQTMSAIAKYHSETTVVTDERLRERKLEPAEGKLFSELGWGKEEVNDLDLKTIGGESWREVYARVEDFMNELKERPENSVLIVTHGGPLRMIESILTGVPLEETIGHLYENCSITEWDV